VLRFDTVMVATPPLNVTGLPVSGVIPSRNATVPVGVPAPGLTADTVAVNVTDWPETVAPEDMSARELFALLTVWVPVSFEDP
jgi:hypothetical protein